MVQGKVLVVDDEPVICWSIEQTLKSAGYDIGVARTVAEGVRLFEREPPPDVVLLDVHLPDGNGFDLLRRMKMELHWNTSVIVMTAFSDSASCEHAQRLGAYAYLKKPFEFDQLALLVGEALKAAKAKD